MVFAICIPRADACRLQSCGNEINHWLAEWRGLRDHVINNIGQSEGSARAGFGLLQLDDPQIEWPSCRWIKLVLRRDCDKRLAAATHCLAFDRCMGEPEVVNSAERSDPCLQGTKDAGPRSHQIAQGQKLSKQAFLLLHTEATTATTKEVMPAPCSCDGDRKGFVFRSSPVGRIHDVEAEPDKGFPELVIKQAKGQGSFCR